MQTREQSQAEIKEYQRLIKEAQAEAKKGNLKTAKLIYAIAELHRQECRIPLWFRPSYLN